MANNVIAWAYQIKHITPLEKFVLVTLADQANKDGSCYPGVQTIAKDCNISERYARIIVRNIEIHGLMSSLQRYRDNGSFSSKLYQLRITIDPATWTPATPKGRLRGVIMSTSLADDFFKALADKMLERNEFEQFKTWMFPLSLVTIEGPRLIMKAPNELFVDLIRRKYTAVILETAQTVFKTARTARVRKLHLITDKKKQS